MFINLLIVFLISMVPIVELRGAISYAGFIAQPPIEYWLAAIVAVVGNFIPVPLIILCMDKLLALFGKTKHIGPILNKFVGRAEKKAKSIGKYAFLELMLFVGIPLPGTGAWTAALVSSILKLPMRKSLLAISVGLLCSVCIMGVFAYLLPDWFQTLFVG